MKLKTIEITAETTINRIGHAVGDVVEVLEHWAEDLIGRGSAKASTKKPTRPSPTPLPDAPTDSTTAKAVEAGPAAAAAKDGTAAATGDDSKPAG